MFASVHIPLETNLGDRCTIPNCSLLNFLTPSFSSFLLKKPWTSVVELAASKLKIGNRIFGKSISYLSHLTMKPRIKETKIWTLEKWLLCAEVFRLSLIDVLMLHGNIFCISLKALMKMMKKVFNLIPPMCMFGLAHWWTVWISSWLEPRLKQMPQVAPQPPQPPSQWIAATSHNYWVMIIIGIMIEIRHCNHSWVGNYPRS